MPRRRLVAIGEHGDVPDPRARPPRRLRPTVSIWFHQHLDLVDESGGDATVEQQFARRSGLRLARLPREPGSVVGWTNHEVGSGTAFVVELPPGKLTEGAVARLARAVVSVSGSRTAT
jgi:hypothetical protein